jgi:hypothetical protein
VSWERLVLGPRGRSLGSSRWPAAALIALVGAVVSILGSLWLQAAIFFVAALVLGAVAVKTWSK